MRLEKMSSKEVEEYFSENDSVLLAIGSIEIHGSHNVLGVDTIIPSFLLDKIEEEIDILIPPMIPYGACDYLSDFPGTINLGVDLLYELLSKITEELYKHGARKFYFLNGHGGNIPALRQVSLDLDKKNALGFQFNWWQLVWSLNENWQGGHGGAQETSAMLYIDEDLVSMENSRDMNLSNDLNDEFERVDINHVRYKGVDIPVARSIKKFTDNGWVGKDHPKNATKEWGEDMLLSCVEYLCDFIMEAEKITIDK